MHILRAKSSLPESVNCVLTAACTAMKAVLPLHSPIGYSILLRLFSSLCCKICSSLCTGSPYRGGYSTIKCKSKAAPGPKNTSSLASEVVIGTKHLPVMRSNNTFIFIFRGIHIKKYPLVTTSICCLTKPLFL